MRKIKIGLILLFFFSALKSQSQVFIKLAVKDSLENFPIAGATVKLYNKGALVKVNTTNSLGELKFELDTIYEGILEVLHLEYQSKKLSINGKNQSINFRLIKNYQLIDSINIIAQKTIYSPEKTTFIINTSTFSNNQTSIDVLKKTPTISIINSEVRVMGDKNVAYTFNGKEVDYDFIKLLPAKSITRIEIIEPNVKNEEGKFVVINIVSNKRLDGYAVTMNQAIGTRDRITSSISGKIKKNRFSINSSLQLHKYKNEGSHSLINITPEEKKIVYEGTRDASFKNLIYSNDIAYDLDSSSYLSLYTNYLRSPNSNRILTIFPNENLESSTNSRNSLLNTSLQYRKNKNKSLFTSNMYYRYNRQKDLFSSYNNYSEGINNYNTITTNQFGVQADFSSQKNTAINYSIGAKYLFRDNNNIYRLLEESETTQTQIENIFSAYSEGIWKNKVIDIVSTLNLELYRGNIQSKNIRNLNKLNLLYTVLLSKKIDNDNTLKLNLSKVTYRPSINLLSLFQNKQDINNIRIGNDQLNPEIQHIFRLSYNTRISNIHLYLTNTLKHSRNEISPFFENVNDTITKSFINLNNKISYTPSLDISYNKGILYNQINITYNIFNISDADISISNPNLSYFNLTYSFDVSLPRNWSIDGSIMYNSGTSYIQSKDKGYLYSDLSINKEFKNRFRISLEYLDIFNRSSNFINSLYLDKVYNQNVLYNSNIIRMRLSYSFGKDFSIKTSRRMDNNDLRDF